MEIDENFGETKYEYDEYNNMTSYKENGTIVSTSDYDYSYNIVVKIWFKYKYKSLNRYSGKNGKKYKYSVKYVSIYNVRKEVKLGAKS